MALCVGFDTSNYTTSAAWWDGREGRNESRILDVPPGRVGAAAECDAFFCTSDAFLKLWRGF